MRNFSIIARLGTRLRLLSGQHSDLPRSNLYLNEADQMAPEVVAGRVGEAGSSARRGDDAPNAKGNLGSALIQWHPRAASATRLTRMDRKLELLELTVIRDQS
jgi:hypothetical protein